MVYNINAWNLLCDNKTRVLIYKAELQKVGFVKGEMGEEVGAIDKEPVWVKQDSKEIIELMDDGLRYRKLKELKQIEKEMVN